MSNPQQTHTRHSSIPAAGGRSPSSRVKALSIWGMMTGLLEDRA